MSSPQSPLPTPPGKPSSSVFTRLLNGQQLVYELASNVGSGVRSAGRVKVFSSLAAITIATIMSYDRQFREQRGITPAPPEKATALNKVENSLIVKADRPAWQSMSLGFWSSLVKPAIVAQKVMRTATGAEVPQSELLAMMLALGIRPMVVNGFKVMAEPEMYAKAAEVAANQAVESAKQRLYLLPWQVITFQVPITKVRDEYLRLRNATDEATRQAATFHQDGVQVFNSAFRYYTTSKLFEFAGGVGAGALTAFAYNRYLADPAQRYFGPISRTATRVATMPLRPVIPRVVAEQLGTLIARRSPLAILLMLQGLGTYYHTQMEFQKFVNDLATSYPEYSAHIVGQMKTMQGSPKNE